MQIGRRPCFGTTFLRSKAYSAVRRKESRSNRLRFEKALLIQIYKEVGSSVERIEIARTSPSKDVRGKMIKTPWDRD